MANKEEYSNLTMKLFPVKVISNVEISHGRIPDFMESESGYLFRDRLLKLPLINFSHPVFTAFAVEMSRRKLVYSLISRIRDT